MPINIIIPEILLLLNYMILIIYYGFYFTSNTYNYLVSYKQNVVMPILILLSVIIIQLKYPFHNQYILNESIYINNYNNWFKVLTNTITLVICLTSYIYIKNLRLNNFENYLLLISSQIGILVLLMANNIILLYLSLELVTITIYVLISLNKINNYNIESGLKYFIIGAVSSGIFLMGIGILYGATGIITLTDLNLYSFFYNSGVTNTTKYLDFYLILSLIFVITSLLFKIYSAPFHLWISDIYQGTPIHALTYISTIPSFVNTLILVKFLLIFNNMFPISYLILFFALISIISGAVGALLQIKLKRLIAYSSVSHVGYFLLALSIYLSSNILGLFTFFFYYVLYMTNLILVFTILLQNTAFKNKWERYSMDQINDYNGLYNQNSYYVLSLVAALFSIAGIPPFVGFFGKFYLILSLISSGYSLFVSIIFILVAVISCYYYLNIIKNIYYLNIKNYLYFNYSTINNIIISILMLFLSTFIFVLNDISIVISNILLSVVL